MLKNVTSLITALMHVHLESLCCTERNGTPYMMEYCVHGNHAFWKFYDSLSFDENTWFESQEFLNFMLVGTNIELGTSCQNQKANFKKWMDGDLVRCIDYCVN